MTKQIRTYFFLTDIIWLEKFDGHPNSTFADPCEILNY